MKKPLSAATYFGAALAKLAMVAAIVIAATTFDPAPAEAMCRTYGPPAGSWVNVDPDTREITRIRIRYSCNDTLAIPADATPEEIAELRARLGQNWSVQMWGKCHPRYCAWGGASASKGPRAALEPMLPRAQITCARVCGATTGNARDNAAKAPGCFSTPRKRAADCCTYGSGAVSRPSKPEITCEFICPARK